MDRVKIKGVTFFKWRKLFNGRTSRAEWDAFFDRYSVKVFTNRRLVRLMPLEVLEMVLPSKITKRLKLETGFYYMPGRGRKEKELVR